MATSSTYTFNPEVVDVIDEAFERCGIDPATLGERHLRSARMSANLLFIEWANDGVSLYMVQEQTQTLTQGDLDYALPTGSIAILDCVIRRDGVDTPVHRITREQYHQIPDKDQEGFVSMIYHDRRTNLFYLWLSPDNSVDVLRYYTLRRRQDISVTLSQNPDAAYLWLDALCAGVASRLSVKYAPTRFESLKKQYDDAFKVARGEDRERAELTMEPGI